MSDFFETRDEFIKIEKEIENLELKSERLLAKLRAECKHEIVVWRDYIPENVILNAQPPAKRCLICGEIENGWGCDYRKIRTKPIKEVTCDEFDTLRKLEPLIEIEHRIPISLVKEFGWKVGS